MIPNFHKSLDRLSPIFACMLNPATDNLMKYPPPPWVYSGGGPSVGVYDVPCYQYDAVACVKGVGCTFAHLFSVVDHSE